MISHSTKQKRRDSKRKAVRDSIAQYRIYPGVIPGRYSLRKEGSVIRVRSFPSYGHALHYMKCRAALEWDKLHLKLKGPK